MLTPLRGHASVYNHDCTASVYNHDCTEFEITRATEDSKDQRQQTYYSFSNYRNVTLQVSTCTSVGGIFIHAEAGRNPPKLWPRTKIQSYFSSLFITAEIVFKFKIRAHASAWARILNLNTGSLLMNPGFGLIGYSCPSPPSTVGISRFMRGCWSNPCLKIRRVTIHYNISGIEDRPPNRMWRPPWPNTNIVLSLKTIRG